MKEKILTGLTLFFTLGVIISINDKSFYEYFAIYLFLALVSLYYLLKSKKETKDQINQNKKTNSGSIYKPKSLLTPTEYQFYQKISCLENSYKIVPQVNLAAIINKEESKYHSELFRNVDFGIFTKDFKLLLLIELNDSTHNKINRKDRDLKVQKILNDCNIELIKFYTCYPNEQHYVLNRINKELEKIKSTN